MNTMIEAHPRNQKDRTPTMCLVIHASDRPAEACLDGRGFVIPPNEVWEVPSIVCTDHNNNGAYEYTTPSYQVMAALIDQCWADGLVEVPVIKDKGKFGVQYRFDEDAAHAKAKQALIAAEEKMLLAYVTIQRERMNQNMPALPPNGRVKEVIEKRNIDLKREYNLDPIGYGTVARAAAAGEQMASMQAQLDEQRRINTELTEKMNRLIAAMEPAPAPSKKRD